MSSNRRRRRRNPSRHHRSSHQFSRRKKAGWGMNLYRNTRDGKIAGVSAGLADHWDIATWVVRLMWIAGFLFTGTLALWLYLAAWIFMAPRPSHYGAESDYDTGSDYDEVEVEMEYDERRHDYVPRKVFRYSDSGSVRLDRARDRLEAALARVEDMETYVTSRQYNLNKEFSKL